MTEKESREGTGGAKDNVEDELDEATGTRRRDAVEEESTGGGGSGTKDNVSDDLRKSQER